MQYNSDEYLKELIKKRNYETKRKRIEKVKIASYPVFWMGIAGIYSLAASQVINYNKPYLLGISAVAALIAISNVILYIKEKLNNLKIIKEKEDDLTAAIKYEIESEFNKKYPSIYWVTKEDKIEYLQEKQRLYKYYNVSNKDINVSTKKLKMLKKL